MKYINILLIIVYFFTNNVKSENGFDPVYWRDGKILQTMYNFTSIENNYSSVIADYLIGINNALDYIENIIELKPCIIYINFINENTERLANTSPDFYNFANHSSRPILKNETAMKININIFYNNETYFGDKFINYSDKYMFIKIFVHEFIHGIGFPGYFLYTQLCIKDEQNNTYINLYNGHRLYTTDDCAHINKKHHILNEYIPIHNDIILDQILYDLLITMGFKPLFNVETYNEINSSSCIKNNMFLFLFLFKIYITLVISGYYRII